MFADEDIRIDKQNRRFVQTLLMCAKESIPMGNLNTYGHSDITGKTEQLEGENN